MSNNLSFLTFLLCWNAWKIVAQGTGQRGCLGPEVKKFSSLLYTHTFFLKPNKKNYNTAKELYCDRTIFVFWLFIVYSHRKMGTEKWPKATKSPLHSVLKLLIYCNWCSIFCQLVWSTFFHFLATHSQLILYANCMARWRSLWQKFSMPEYCLSAIAVSLLPLRLTADVQTTKYPAKVVSSRYERWLSFCNRCKAYTRANTSKFWTNPEIERSQILYKPIILCTPKKFLTTPKVEQSHTLYRSRNRKKSKRNLKSCY